MAGNRHSAFSAFQRGSTVSVDSLHLGAYVGTQIGDIRLKAGSSYSFNDIDTSRSIRLAGIGQKLSGDYDSGLAQVFGEAFYGIDLSAMGVDPFASFAS